MAAHICSCGDGYTGENCETNIYECELNPCVNGYCSGVVSGYEYTCSEGFIGMNCENNIDECEFADCNHGRCKDEVNGFTCICRDGYTYMNCDEVLRCSFTHSLLSHTLPDSAFSASREPYTVNPASQSRFYNNGWKSDAYELGEWIAVDLGVTCLVEAIKTQGVGSVYTKKYKVNSSFDGFNWLDVTDVSESY